VGHAYRAEPGGAVFERDDRTARVRAGRGSSKFSINGSVRIRAPVKKSSWYEPVRHTSEVRQSVGQGSVRGSVGVLSITRSCGLTKRGHSVAIMSRSILFGKGRSSHLDCFNSVIVTHCITPVTSCDTLSR